MTQRRRFFAATPVQTVPGQTVAVEVQLRKEAAPVAMTPVPVPDGSVIVDADYLVIRYVFTEADGRDLDTRTRVYSPILAPVDFMGWARSQYVARPGGVRGSVYAEWGGDNTGYGVESVLVDVREVAAEFPAEILSIETRALWYGERHSGLCALTVDVYKGGVMSLGNYEFSNLGGELVASLSKTVDVPTHIQDSEYDGDFLTFVCYDIARRRLSFDCSPQPGKPIEGGEGEGEGEGEGPPV